MKYGLIALVLVLFAGVAYAMSDFIVPKTWNYKITIEIETPEGTKTGQSVRKFKIHNELAGYINPSAGIVTYNVVGEAAFIDLGEGRVLIDLPNPYNFLDAFPYQNNATKVEYYKKRISLGDIGALDVSKHSFVMFTNMDDPKSIRTVLPEDFQSIFGSNVKLKSIIVEVTDQSVTWGQVRKNLKWYDTGKMGMTFEEIQRSIRQKENVDQARLLTKESLIKGE